MSETTPFDPGFLTDSRVSQIQWVRQSENTSSSSGPCNWRHCGQRPRETSDVRSLGPFMRGDSRQTLHLHSGCYDTAMRNARVSRQISAHLLITETRREDVPSFPGPGSLVRISMYRDLHRDTLHVDLPSVCANCRDEGAPLQADDYLMRDGCAGFHVVCVGELDRGAT